MQYLPYFLQNGEKTVVRLPSVALKVQNVRILSSFFMILCNYEPKMISHKSLIKVGKLQEETELQNYLSDLSWKQKPGRTGGSFSRTKVDAYETTRGEVYSFSKQARCLSSKATSLNSHMIKHTFSVFYREIEHPNPFKFLSQRKSTL